MDTKAVLARFDAERQALALMDLPNIACMDDGGTTEKGQRVFAASLVLLSLVAGVVVSAYFAILAGEEAQSARKAEGEAG